MRAARALVVAILFSGTARAAGFGIPDLGAAALGQAGATIAAPADPSALYYNPAALSWLAGVQLLADLRAIDHRIIFQRLDANGDNSGGWAQVENQGGLALAPLFGASWQAGRLTLGAGGHPLNGGSGYRYPDGRSPQRYVSIESRSKVYVPVLAAAWALTPWLSVGAGLQLPVASFVARLAVYAGPIPGEIPDFDAPLRVSATQWFSRSGILGVSVKTDDVAAGISLQLPMRFSAQGTAVADLPPAATGFGVGVEGDQARIDFAFPWMLKAGVRTLHDRWSVELAGTFEHWSSLREITVTPLDVVVRLNNQATPLAPLILHKDLKNAVSLRLGGEFVALPWLVLRAGILGETSAIPEERQSLDWLNWQRLSLNAGVGIRYDRFEASLGLARFLQPDRQVRTSEVRQLTAFPVEPVVVGNGDYASNLTVAAFSVTARL